jgi:hypothetical protein
MVPDARRELLTAEPRTHAPLAARVYIEVSLVHMRLLL